MSRNDDIRESLLSISELLKQLTEEVESLADCFYEEEEDEDEAEEAELTPEMVLEEASFEDRMVFCNTCDRKMMCPNLHNVNCEIMKRKVMEIIGGMKDE